MGLLSFPTAAAEGVLPVLVINTVLYVALLKNMMRSLLRVMGANWIAAGHGESTYEFQEEHVCRERRVSITQFKSLLCLNGAGIDSSSSGRVAHRLMECCVCVCGFEAEEEVSELSCKHFFHKNCLDKWFGNRHSTCPLCRSVH